MDWEKINKGKRPPKLSREATRKRRDFSLIELLGGEDEPEGFVNWEFGKNTFGTEAIVEWRSESDD